MHTSRDALGALAGASEPPECPGIQLLGLGLIAPSKVGCKRRATSTPGGGTRPPRAAPPCPVEIPARGRDLGRQARAARLSNPRQGLQPPLPPLPTPRGRKLGIPSGTGKIRHRIRAQRVGIGRKGTHRSSWPLLCTVPPGLRVRSPSLREGLRVLPGAPFRNRDSAFEASDTRFKVSSLSLTCENEILRDT